MSKNMRIALTGNPNSGKTTLYNALTGRSERVGNWAGVTVEMKEYKIKSTYLPSDAEFIAVDLPGAYSMSPYTSEESITRTYIVNEKPDVIINIVDATNLSRSLFFTTQLLELGIPVVVALNKSDLNEKKNIEINTQKLAELLGCPVVKTVSTDAADEGLKELIATAKIISNVNQKAPFHEEIKDITNKDEVSAVDKKRFDFVKSVVAKVEKRQTETSEKTIVDKIDAIIAHKYLGIVIFAAVMFLVFQISQAWVGPWFADLLCGWIDAFGEFVGGLLENAHPILTSILVDGIIGGVGAVVGFLPLVMVMYFLIALLEDCGYMSRVAIVMDRFFKKVGLSGKSIIPMIIGTGCAIPGVMACRTIKDERERRATAMLTPFMPCGAKLPVIALFAGAFFADAAWVGTLMYFMGIALIIGGALLIKLITGVKYRKSFFIIEMPEYKAPSVKRATFSMLGRAKAFIIKAGTIILVCNAVVQIMSDFTWAFEFIGEEGDASTSILASIATPFAWLLIPLGFGVWQLAAAAVTGFIAKENVVGTLAVVYGITNFIDTDALEMVDGASSAVASTMGITSVVALSYLIFNLFTPPCFAAIGAMNSEMRSKKWLFAGIGLQFAAAYVCSFLVYQFGTLFTAGTLGSGFVPGLIVVVAIVAFVAYLVIKGKDKVLDYSLNKDALN